MTFACIGWGSLIWCQKALPLKSAWFRDGPALPIEFARESRDQRITLVICDGIEPIRTLWAELDVDTLEQAKSVLADREGISKENIRHSVGFWTPGNKFAGPGADFVESWAKQRPLSAVVWTALRPRFRGERHKPTEDEVIKHLSRLQGEERARAEEYIRLAPRQIVTPYRKAIESSLGWTPSGLF